MNILIVDDDSASRLILEAKLKKLGHQVTVAKSGAEAMTALESCPVSCVISDLVMPGIDGLELCRRIRASKRPGYTYIILLTSLTGKSGYLVGMRAGADDFISKPFDEGLMAARLVVAERILNMQSQINQLMEAFPICTTCKKVRDERNCWHPVETYIVNRRGAKLGRNYCPDCCAAARTA